MLEGRRLLAGLLVPMGVVASHALGHLAAGTDTRAWAHALGLLHGDLWNGNVLWGLDAVVHVIDPAAYGGHREADLAMLSLFGLPHLPRVLEAYREASEDVRPLADGWEDRLPLHQLFPLLVHACLFGGGYAARAAEIAARY